MFLLHPDIDTGEMVRKHRDERPYQDPEAFDPTTILHCATELRFLLPLEEFIFDLAVSNCPFCKLMLKGRRGILSLNLVRIVFAKVSTVT